MINLVVGAESRKYLLVWSTKYRRAIMSGEVAVCVRSAIRAACEDYGIAIVKGAVRKDHIKIVVAAPADFTLPVLMQRIKGKSAHILFTQYPVVRTIIPEGPFWAKGYYAVPYTDPHN